MTSYIKQMKTAALLLMLLSLLTGLIYPLIVTGLAQVFFPWRANGSLIKQNNKIIGSQLIGQTFDAENYFWSRPSATMPFPYNSAASAGSNAGPTNPQFINIVRERVTYLKHYHTQVDPIPVDMVTASGSGLDPEMSPLAAYYQSARVAQARHLTQQEVNELIRTHIKSRTFLILGEPRINVLELNIALDVLSQAKTH